MSILYHDPLVKKGKGRAGIVNVSGDIFVCRESSAPFRMQFNDGAPFPCEAGFTLRPPGGFDKVTVINNSDDYDLQVEFYAGDSAVDYHFERVPKTRLKPSGAVDVANEFYVSFPGVDNGNRRKSFTIVNDGFNGSADTVFLSVQTSPGPPAVKVDMAIVYGRGSTQRNWYSIETDADIYVLNPKLVGSGIIPRIYVAEVFYVTT